MGIEATGVELVIHLALFLVGGLTVGLGALAILERLAGAERPIIRWRYVAWVVVAFAALGVVELLYHAFLES